MADAAQRGKYAELYNYLCGRTDSIWYANFAEIEKILGFDLPESAYKYPAWWENETDHNHTHSRAWQAAGWQTSDVNLSAKKVTFTKQ